MTLEEKIDEILDNIGDIAHEHYLGTGKKVSGDDSGWEYCYDTEVVFILDDVRIKQLILALIKEETVKARVEELERIDKANKDNGINFWFEDMKPQNNGWRNMRQYVPERIAQL